MSHVLKEVSCNLEARVVEFTTDLRREIPRKIPCDKGR
jgi:hypothetical protein